MALLQSYIVFNGIVTVTGTGADAAIRQAKWKMKEINN